MWKVGVVIISVFFAIIYAVFIESFEVCLILGFLTFLIIALIGGWIDSKRKEENKKQGERELRKSNISVTGRSYKFWDLTVYSNYNAYGFVYVGGDKYVKHSMKKEKFTYSYKVVVSTGFSRMIDIDNLLPLAAASAFTGIGVIFTGDVKDNCITDISITAYIGKKRETISVFSGGNSPLPINEENIKAIKEFEDFAEKLSNGVI